MIWWSVMLFSAGVLLIILEFILPGLICGVLGACALFAAGALAIWEWPEYTLFIIVGEVFAAMIGIALGLVFLNKSGIASGLVQKHEQRPEEGYTNLASDTALLGAAGVVYSPLRPAGVIRIGERRIDAVSNGVFIDSGAAVRVIEVHGNRVVVEPAGLDPDDAPGH